jgi:hypothetical protein
MATDIALMKKFGSTDLAAEVGKINDEAAAMIHAEPARSKQITKAQKVATDDLLAMVARLRGTYGVPANPDGLLHRAVRVALNHNYISKLGNVTVSSISDLAKPVMNYGLNNTLRTVFHPLVNGTKTIKLAAKEARLAGAALDRSNHARQMSINDVMDNYGRGTPKDERISWLGDQSHQVQRICAVGEAIELRLAQAHSTGCRPKRRRTAFHKAVVQHDESVAV